MTRTLFGTISEAATRSPGTELIIASAQRPAADTLGEIVAAGQRMGTRLAAMDLGPGDVAAIMLPNWREWLVAFVACGHAGCTILPIVPNFGCDDLAFVLGQSRARLLVTPVEWRRTDFAELVAASGPLPDLAHHIRVGADFASLEGEIAVATPAKVGPDDDALLLYTSGTTARPKGVRHSSRGLLAELEAQAAARGDIADEVLLSPWPPGHMAGALAMIRHLAAAVPLVGMDEWDPQIAAELVSRHRVTSSSGTPFHLAGLLAAADQTGADLSSLKHYIVGAAPVPRPLVERCAAAGLSVYRCYGSTEHPTVSSGVASDTLGKRLGTEGRIMSGSEVRFVDEDGLEVPSGTDGEIVTRGGELFLGYLDTALDAAAFLPGGWYRTGDIGRLDEDGYLLVTDRKKDIIIRGGENISSKEIEDLMLEIPGIAEVAVVAAPDARLGEVVRACVVLAAGTSVSIDDISAHFSARGIARHKTPERLDIFPALPRNATGKILKHELRAASSEILHQVR